MTKEINSAPQQKAMIDNSVASQHVDMPEEYNPSIETSTFYNLVAKAADFVRSNQADRNYADIYYNLAKEHLFKASLIEQLKNLPDLQAEHKKLVEQFNMGNSIDPLSDKKRWEEITKKAKMLQKKVDDIIKPSMPTAKVMTGLSILGGTAVMLMAYKCSKKPQKPKYDLVQQQAMMAKAVNSPEVLYAGSGTLTQDQLIGFADMVVTYFDNQKAKLQDEGVGRTSGEKTLVDELFENFISGNLNTLNGEESHTVMSLWKKVAVSRQSDIVTVDHKATQDNIGRLLKNICDTQENRMDKRAIETALRSITYTYQINLDEYIPAEEQKQNLAP